MLKLQTKGLQFVIDKFETFAKETQADVQLALNDFGNRVVKDAKILVSDNSSDEGNLVRNINSDPGNGDVTITANTKYAAYIEFGTRKFAAQYVSSLPSDWQDFAATFKGPMTDGGTFKEFVLIIMEWMKRKGISGGIYSVKTRRRLGNKKQKEKEDKSVAYAIAKKIMIDGIKARPFLYPSIQKNIPLLEDDIKAIFE